MSQEARRLRVSLATLWKLHSSLSKKAYQLQVFENLEEFPRGRTMYVLSSRLPHRGDEGDRVSPCETPLRFSLARSRIKGSSHNRLCCSSKRKRAGSRAETAEQALVCKTQVAHEQ